MPLNAASLRTLLKENLHKDSTFSDPGDLNTFLSLGQRRIVKDSPGTLGSKEGTLSITSAAREYSLASDFYQMLGVFLPATNALISPLPFARWQEEVEYQSSVPSGDPDSYRIVGYSESSSAWRLRWDKTPDTSRTVYYWYWWLPIDITGTATPAVSAIGFDELLVWAATMIARERNDPQGAAVAFQRYTELLRAYRAFGVQGPDYWAALGSDGGRMFSRLGPRYPVDSWR